MATYSATLSTPGDFGRALQQARLSMGLTQSELAQMVGIPQATISQLENGESTIFLRRFLALAEATHLHLDATWSTDEDTQS